MNSRTANTTDRNDVATAKLAPPSFKSGNKDTQNFPFSYSEAFNRNLGLVSEKEQQMFRNTRIGLPGLGGVGGFHLQALTRLGIGSFHLADLDHFEVANINRQAGAAMTSMGKEKTAVMAAMARDMNPEVQLNVFSKGLTSDNVDRFLTGVDIVVDGLDGFSIDVRRLLVEACYQKGIPVVQAGPIGNGAALVVLEPGGMTFDAYCGITPEMSFAQRLVAHLLAHFPGNELQMDPSRIDVTNRRGPALGYVCMLCAALAACEVLKLVTGRGVQVTAPEGRYFDPMQGTVRALTGGRDWMGDSQNRARFDQVLHLLPALREMHEREKGNAHIH